MRRGRLLNLALVGATSVSLTVGLTACSAQSLTENIVGAAVEEGKKALSDTAENLIEDLAAGTSISTDGELPAGFPVDDVPLGEGTVLGGGAGPNSSGWIVNVSLPSVESFEAASTTLTDAGYTAAGVSSDSTSAFGTFTNSTYRVVLTVTTGGDGAVTANYVVVPV
ncbi:MAG: hypothetical protein JWQ68_715 [Cryobacterium sp.]|nr:hypothetical protein [Cryobacterium sp.]